MKNVLRLAIVWFAAANLQAQTVTISPSYTSVGVNGTVQYTATVTGLANKTVTWSVSGVKGGNAKNGTITTGGLYKAPAQIPNNGPTISALASDHKTMAIVYVNVAPVGPPITAVSPNPVPVGTYTVTLTGTGFQTGAEVSAAGITLQTAFVNSTTLKATGWQGAAQTVVFEVMNPGSLWGPPFNVPFTNGGNGPPQTISPATATVALNGTQQFTSSGATRWTATAGTVNGSGLYTAPGTMPKSNIATVTATGPNGSASATITLVSGTPQTISPTAVTLPLNGTQQFTSSGATSWIATAGTVNGSGFYTAPGAMTQSGTDTVTATGPNGSASATVTLLGATPTVQSISPAPIPIGVFTGSITGTGFTNQSVAQLNGITFPTGYVSPTQLNVTGYTAQTGTASLAVSNGGSLSPPLSVLVGVSNPLVTPAAARRFLEQAAFGPTPSDAATVESIGFQAWLTLQFSMPVISNYNGVNGSQGGIPNRFLTNAVTNADQLRQRVAFALSQIFVTSINTIIWNGDMIPFQQMLMADAFTNYQQILSDVSLSPTMGEYLNTANNAMANPAQGTVANENYAREVMQLFSFGTNLLNPDGTPQLDPSGNPIPAYTQFTVTELARVFTGWTYAPVSGPPIWGAYINSASPMVPYPAEHDSGSKTLLNGYVVPANQSPQQDIASAIGNIFNHPNIGPFVSKQLIQHLVKSNPSPAYVQRVAAAFANNGQGVRGDMQAILTAILLDPEARANDNGGNDQSADGHMQEPALFLAGMVRAFGGSMNDQNYYPYDLANMGQDIYDAPSVFNYYAPNYAIPGTPLLGGEFQIFTPYSAVYRANVVANLFSAYANPVQTYGPGTTVDLTSYVALASNPTNLVNALDITLTHGVMPALMKQTLVTAISGDNMGPLHQVQTGVYLILTSNYYNVWH